MCYCVVWEEYWLAQLQFTGWSGLDTDKCVVGRDWGLHWCRLYLMNVLSLEFFTIWKARVFLAVFHSFRKCPQGKIQCFVRSEHCVCVWSSSAISMELDMHKSIPLVTTPSSYILQRLIEKFQGWFFYSESEDSTGPTIFLFQSSVLNIEYIFYSVL